MRTAVRCSCKIQENCRLSHTHVHTDRCSCSCPFTGYFLLDTPSCVAAVSSPDHFVLLQLTLDMPQQALRLIEGVLVTIICNGSTLERARAHLLWIRCHVAAAGKRGQEQKTQGGWYFVPVILKKFHLSCPERRSCQQHERFYRRTRRCQQQSILCRSAIAEIFLVGCRYLTAHVWCHYCFGVR